MSDASQRKTSTETGSPVEDQTASPSLSQLGSGKASRKNRRGKSGGTPAGNVALCGNGLAEDALPDGSELSQQIAEIAQKSQELVAQFLKRQAAEDGIGMANPLAIGAASSR